MENHTKIYTATWQTDVNYIVCEMSDSPESLDADLSTKGDVSKVSVGDIVVMYSRGKYRTAVVNKVGRKNIQAGYATVGGVEEARKMLARTSQDPNHEYYGKKLIQDGGDMHCTVTNKSTDHFWVQLI